MKKIIYLILVVILAGSIKSFSQDGNSQYTISHKFSIGGDGGWDLLTMDEAGGRLFLSHGNMVQVVDVKSGTVTGTIPDTKGVHGIALAPDLNKGFISNGRDSSVTIFDMQSLNFITKIDVTGVNPDVIMYDPSSQKVFVFNARSSNATVIDANTNAVVGTITLPGNPEFSVTDGKGKVYINIEDKSVVCRINALNNAIEQTWSVAPGEEPSGLAIDNANHRLFIVCHNKVMVIMNADDGSIITTLPIGDRVDGAAFDSGNNRAYSSNGDGTLTVVQEDGPNSFMVLENVATQTGARTMALDNSTHHIYLPTAEFGPPPPPTAENPHPRSTILPGTFIVLDVELVK